MGRDNVNDRLCLCYQPYIGHGLRFSDVFPIVPTSRLLVRPSRRLQICRPDLAKDYWSWISLCGSCKRHKVNTNNRSENLQLFSEAIETSAPAAAEYLKQEGQIEGWHIVHVAGEVSYCRIAIRPSTLCISSIQI